MSDCATPVTSTKLNLLFRMRSGKGTNSKRESEDKREETRGGAVLSINDRASRFTRARNKHDSSARQKSRECEEERGGIN